MGISGILQTFRHEDFRRFTEEEVMPLAAQIDRDEHLPVELIRKLGRQVIWVHSCRSVTEDKR